MRERKKVKNCQYCYGHTDVTSASNSSCYIRNLMIFDIAIRVMTTAEVLEFVKRPKAQGCDVARS